MMCVNDTLPRPVRASWLFKIDRFTSRSFAGMVRTEVAVGTARLAAMFSTCRTAPPRSGCASAGAGVATTGFGSAAGRGAALAGLAGGVRSALAAAPAGV